MLISCDGRVQSLCEFVDPPLVLFRTRSDILCRVLASVLRIETSGGEGNENKPFNPRVGQGTSFSCADRTPDIRLKPGLCLSNVS